MKILDSLLNYCVHRNWLITLQGNKLFAEQFTILMKGLDRTNEIPIEMGVRLANEFMAMLFEDNPVDTSSFLKFEMFKAINYMGYEESRELTRFGYLAEPSRIQQWALIDAKFPHVFDYNTFTSFTALWKPTLILEKLSENQMMARKGIHYGFQKLNPQSYQKITDAIKLYLDGDYEPQPKDADLFNFYRQLGQNGLNTGNLDHAIQVMKAGALFELESWSLADLAADSDPLRSPQYAALQREFGDSHKDPYVKKHAKNYYALENNIHRFISDMLP
jgi:hypothetical protein